MDEIELYHALSEWMKEKDPTPIGGRPTFLVICATQDDERVGILVGHVDPLMPKKIPKPPLDQTLAQNVLILVKQCSKPLINECIESAVVLNTMVEEFGKEIVRTLINESSNADEFIERLQASSKLEA